MSAIVNVVLPVFGIVLVGYAAGRLRLLGPASSEALNGFVYWVAMPALVLRGLARAPLEGLLDLPYLAAFAGGMLAAFLLALAVARRFFPGDFTALSVHALGASFPNSGYMGLPLFALAFGEDGMLPVIVANVAQLIVMVSLAMLLFEVARGRGPLWPRALPILRRVLANPFLIATAIGLGMNASGVGRSGPFDTLLRTLGEAATPCALAALGLFLVGKSIASHLAETLWVSFFKLVVHPALAYAIAAWLFGFPAETVRNLVLIAALPTGALVFVVAQQYQASVERASATVLVSTVLSLVSISALMVLYGL